MNYDNIKQDLLGKQQELEQRLSRTQNHIKHKDGPPDPDFAEQAVERQNEEVVYGLDEAARVELQQIKEALERIENDEYGICMKCGGEIPLQRLEAIPFTPCCVGCMES